MFEKKECQEVSYLGEAKALCSQNLVSSFDVELAKIRVVFLLTEGFQRNRMNTILTITGFGAEKYTGFWILKKRNLSFRYCGTETNAGDRK